MIHLLKLDCNNDWNLYICYCLFRLSQALQKRIEDSTKEEGSILSKQEALKKELYGRFGDSINLEN